MVRSRSRSRVRRRTRDRSREHNRHRSRSKRDYRRRSNDSGRSRSGNSRHKSKSRERQQPVVRDGSYIRDQHSLADRDSRRSRDRDRRHSRSIHRGRSRERPENRVRSRSPSPNVRDKRVNPSRGSPRFLSPIAFSCRTPPLPDRTKETSAPCSEASTLAHALIQAIKTIQPNKIQSQHYFISNFDPSIHNFETWCEEVDRAREANNWSDQECLSRVASGLKGDAKVWLSEWVTNDRTWTNFKREFKALCPSKLDYANILFNAMNATSDKYPTYAEYARRTLLRLRVVEGLSDDLRTLIVIRGIDSPQIRAAAANAELTADKLVSFLSIYSKPKNNNSSFANDKKRPFMKPNLRGESKCFNCGQRGHFLKDCKTPKQKTDATTSSTQQSSGSSKSCTFCKKLGHTEDTCFTKARSESRNH